MSQRRTIWGQYAKVVELPPCNKGRNARGIALHKPAKSRTKKPKRQYAPGFQPRPVVAYRMVRK